MGNVVCLMVIPVITFVKGNAKSGDTLISCFGGKNCIARVPRMCLCGKADLHCTDAYGSEWHTKEHWMKRWCSCWSHQRHVQVSSLNLTVRGEPMKRRWSITWQLLMPCQLIIVTTPSLMSSLVTIHSALCLPLHQTCCQTFVDSMSTNVRVWVDNLMETLFHLQRTTLSNSQNFLRTIFCSGAMHLMMLSSHHWPGMMFTFLLLLLTPQDEDICSSCFQDNDIKEPDYYWDSAPSLDLEYMYQLPILSQDGNDGNDNGQTVGRSDTNEGRTLKESHTYEKRPT